MTANPLMVKLILYKNTLKSLSHLATVHPEVYIVRMRNAINRKNVVLFIAATVLFLMSCAPRKASGVPPVKKNENTSYFLPTLCIAIEHYGRYRRN